MELKMILCACTSRGSRPWSWRLLPRQLKVKSEWEGARLRSKPHQQQQPVRVRRRQRTGGVDPPSVDQNPGTPVLIGRAVSWLESRGFRLIRRVTLPTSSVLLDPPRNRLSTHSYPMPLLHHSIRCARLISMALQLQHLLLLR